VAFPRTTRRFMIWFDESKSYVADFRHRSLRHHAEGISWLSGSSVRRSLNSDGKAVPVRYIGEQHVKEDLGRIPSFQDWIQELPTRPWMYGQKLAKAQKL
jgi:hypothetical protein